jgi:hypothetical protein
MNRTRNLATNVARPLLRARAIGGCHSGTERALERIMDSLKVLGASAIAAAFFIDSAHAEEATRAIASNAPIESAPDLEDLLPPEESKRPAVAPAAHADPRPPAGAATPPQSTPAAPRSGAPAPTDRAPESKLRRSRAYVHDGWYFRMGLGFGGTMDVVGTVEDDRDDGDRSQITGIGAAAELALGHSVADGLVLGGGIWTTQIASSTYFHDRGRELPESLRKPQDFTLIGPFADWYFVPSRGFHAQAGIGFAELSGYRWAQADFSGEDAAFGGGLMLGVGYEWWVDRQWGLGALARLTSAIVAQDEAGTTWVHAVTTFPALMLSATYN